MKNNRQAEILKKLSRDGSVKVTDLQKELNVTEMTIRRDLDFLEKEGLLIRVLGGAKPVSSPSFPSQSTLLKLEYEERRQLNKSLKEEIAKKAAKLVNDNEVIFISAGSTNEFIAPYLTAKNIKVITNCLYIFFIFNQLPNVEAILIGGKYNSFIQSFLGTMTFEGLKNINFTSSFIGTNAISDNKIYASNEEEGLIHKTVLDNSTNKYIMCDTTKFNTIAFFNFYNCSSLTAILSNDGEFDNKDEYLNLCNIL